MMPNGWKLVEAQDVCKSISVGVVIKPTQYYVEEADGVKAFRSANVREGFINDNDWVYFSHEGHSANKKSQLKAGDVLIVRTGYPGTACVVTPEFEGSNAIDIVIARPDVEQVVPEYLCAYTNSHIGKSQVLDLQGGMAQKHLNVGAYQVLKIKLPPLPEQTKIAQILSTWDKAITTTEQLLANSQQQKKALMQQLLTGKKRLLDKNGIRFSGEWRSKPLSDIAEVYQPKTIPQSMLIETGYPVYGANGIIGFYEEFNHATEQIAVTCRGSTCGVVNWTQAQSWITGNAMVINTDNFPAVSKKFLFYVLDGSNLSYLISGSGQPQITGSIKTHVVKIPALEEQQKIAAVLCTADQEISALQQKLDALKQEKKALMQQLLTGKRRVTLN